MEITTTFESGNNVYYWNTYEMWQDYDRHLKMIQRHEMRVAFLHSKEDITIREKETYLRVHYNDKQF